MSEAYDPPSNKNSKINEIQNTIDNTVDIMRQNIDRTRERQNDLENLENQATTLNTSAAGFKRSAHEARKHFWWQNMKMKMCLIVAVIILIIVIVVPIAVHFK